MKPENLKDKIITYEELSIMLKLKELAETGTNKIEDWKNFERHFRIVLKCLKCKHKELLFKFRKIKKTTWSSNDIKEPTFYLDGTDYSKFFYCPKCDNSMIVIDPSEILKVVSWIV